MVLAVALLGAPTIFHNLSPHNSAQRTRSGIVTLVDDAHAVLWSEPTDVERRDLFYGPGGRAHQPHGTFTFVREDLDGSRQKFEGRDADRMQWKAKRIGARARKRRPVVRCGLSATPPKRSTASTKFASTRCRPMSIAVNG